MTPEIVNIILGIINAAFLIYVGFKKLKPEVKKMEVEVDSEQVEAANLNLEGAKISASLLIARIEDLKKELEDERALRQKELQAEREARASELQAEREARRKEGEYLRRRMRESDREARDYRSWAAKLVKQVIDLKGIPASFVPSVSDDSETIIAITRQQQENQEKRDKDGV